MKKTGIVRNVAEDLFELGRATAKDTAKAVAQTVNPVSILERAAAPGSVTPQEYGTEKPGQGTHSTPLKMQQLKDKFEDEDKIKLEAMRGRLFKLVKEGEEKAISDNKQQSEERKQEDQRHIQQKKHDELELKKQQESGSIPHGKVRRSILGAHKKKALEQHQETKPGTSKG